MSWVVDKREGKLLMRSRGNVRTSHMYEIWIGPVGDPKSECVKIETTRTAELIWAALAVDVAKKAMNIKRFKTA